MSLAAAEPKSAAGQPQATPQQDIAAPLNEIAAILKEVNKPAKHDQPCEQGGENRSSDLCAQWKAADGADSAARAAWWLGSIGALIGALTLIAAGAAAWYARKAAIHTESSANEAKRTADAAEEDLRHNTEITKAQLRAYLAAQSESFEIIDNVKCSIRLNLKNVGHTPAYELKTIKRAIFTIAGPHHSRSNNIAFTKTAMGTVGPQVPIESYADVALTPAQIVGLRVGRARLEYFVQMDFLDAFDERWVYSQHLAINAESFVSGLVFTKHCETKRLVEEGELEPELPLEGGEDAKERA